MMTELEKYYNKFNEEKRLKSRHGQVEFITSMKYIHKYLPKREHGQVKILDVEYDEEMEFFIVGSTEANSLQNKISNEAPVGRALIGKSVGDVVDVETQAGIIQYKVLEIQRVS